MNIKFLAPVLAVVVGVYMLSGVLQASHLPPVNGDFETGTLAGWTPFLTANGTQRSAPTVVSFDMDGDGTPSSVARFQLGSADGYYGGGGIYQAIHLAPGTYTVSADIAVGDMGSFGGVDTPGRFELLVDGVVKDTHDFNPVPPYLTLIASLAVSSADPYEIRIRITRPYPPSSKLVQVIDNVSVVYESGSSSPPPDPTATPVPPEPEPLGSEAVVSGGTDGCYAPGDVKDELLGLTLMKGLENSLTKKLDAATGYLADGMDQKAIDNLDAFIKHVENPERQKDRRRGRDLPGRVHGTGHKCHPFRLASTGKGAPVSTRPGGTPGLNQRLSSRRYGKEQRQRLDIR